eukprot:CAMPEP_0181307922 /NCGR_PEP_ID=MMETSP1101-20121128/11160_1 /TAXON_ID=46948 /ORGANISM="Rhodomonas abbreviata, Strain Caron Lab Isolate" /LENGTH=285 /DNA_ID=CAMNT_0023414215 /DNA_START=191 /DNA_END=1045 /DNA_ORIENTATION=-
MPVRLAVLSLSLSVFSIAQGEAPGAFGHGGTSARTQELAKTGEHLEMLAVPWAGGQLHPGEKRERLSPDISVPEAGRIHIGTHEFYQDQDGVRKIDKVLSGYIQGICTDFTSEDRRTCEANGYSWYKCPEDFPHADSKIRAAKVHIPVCYTQHRYAEAGKGPPKSWCVPSHLISFGPAVADWIDQGLGVVCDTKERADVVRETDDAQKWRKKAEKYKKMLADEKGLEDETLRDRLSDEKRKDREWKRLANAYKRQVEDDRDSAKVAVDQLQDALQDMQQKGGGSS